MIVFLICAVIASIGIVFSLLQAYAVGSLFRRNRKGRSALLSCSPFPPVSILKPLRGLDDNLFDNLSSFCTQDYPEYEVLFAVQDRNDPAYKVAKKVRDRYPDQRITIVVERCSAGLNPKVNNLIPAYKQSSHPYILISDSNVLVGPDYLKTIMADARRPNVGLVSNVIRGVGGRSLGALFENLHLNSFIIGSVSFLDRFLGMPCVVGKSMLMKKTDLEALGGLVAFKDVLAEDFIIGREMRKAGKDVLLSGYLVQNVNEYWSVKRFLNRHTRWGKLRRHIGGPRYLSEILANPIFAAVVPILLNPTSRIALGFAAAVSAVKVLADLAVHSLIRRSSGGTLVGKQTALAFLLVPVKDILIGLVWFVPLVSTSVVWRGNRYRIGTDSRLSPMPETGFWSWGYRITNVIRERFA
jgi:ceramide glucosyltransferase